jgi:hypothetical protein
VPHAARTLIQRQRAGDEEGIQTLGEPRAAAPLSRGARREGALARAAATQDYPHRFCGGNHEHSGLVPHGMSVILNAPAVFRFTSGARGNQHTASPCVR